MVGEEGSGSIFSRRRLIVTVKVLSLTYSPAKSQIAFKRRLRERTCPGGFRNTKSSRYSRAERWISLPSLLTEAFTVSMLKSPRVQTEGLFAASLKNVFNTGNKFQRPEGFCNVIVCAQGKTGDSAGFITHGSEKNNRKLLSGFYIGT